MRGQPFGTWICLFLLIGIFAPGATQEKDPLREDSVYILEGHDNAVTDVAFLPEGVSAVSSGLDGTIRLWDISQGRMQQVLYANRDEIFALATSQDGSKIASTEYKGQVRVLEIYEKNVKHLTGSLGWSADVAFSPDSNKVVSWSMDGDIWIWDSMKGELTGTFKGKKNKWGMALAWSPDGTCVAAGRIAITIWDVESKKQIRTLEGHKDFIRDIVFSPDGKYLASASMDKTIRVWDMSTGKSLYTLEPQGLVIYLKSGPVTNPIGLPMTTVAFSPDGKLLATGGADRVVRLWDSTTGKVLKELKGHRMSITAVAFSPDGKRLLSSSLDHTIRVWDVK